MDVSLRVYIHYQKSLTNFDEVLLTFITLCSQDLSNIHLLSIGWLWYLEDTVEDLCCSDCSNVMTFQVLVQLIFKARSISELISITLESLVLHLSVECE